MPAASEPFVVNTGPVRRAISQSENPVYVVPGKIDEDRQAMKVFTWHSVT